MAIKPTVAFRAVLIGGLAAFAKIAGVVKAAGGAKVGAAAAGMTAAATADAIVKELLAQSLTLSASGRHKVFLILSSSSWTWSSSSSPPSPLFYDNLRFPVRRTFHL
ncbi:hypothetical protein F0562_030650 [Nyssa sinensis]|uniref:Uncharacterized protein n=1 Tax=Nyssa sinensis TaxID=561372 RepID=A0A5J5B1H6_9ASTE|nr:hypothetical protein F0562_030650 [Nyssa sinensis]